VSTRRIAILIDGSFFLKRLPRLVPADRCDTPGNIVRQLRDMCRGHVKMLTHCTDKNWRGAKAWNLSLTRYGKKSTLTFLSISTDCNRCSSVPTAKRQAE